MPVLLKAAFAHAKKGEHCGYMCGKRHYRAAYNGALRPFVLPGDFSRRRLQLCRKNVEFNSAMTRHYRGVRRMRLLRRKRAGGQLLMR